MQKTKLNCEGNSYGTLEECSTCEKRISCLKKQVDRSARYGRD